MRRIYYYLLGFCFVGLLHLSSCRDIEFTESTDVNLTFNVDTLRFDTVFTTVGSATRILKIYNADQKAIRIGNITLDKGENSRFRLNVDGTPGNIAQDVEILGQDSLYIFVEVTIDPDDPVGISPFILEEYLTFDINGNEQQVLLEAWGQNANYFPSKSSKGSVNLLTCDMESITWDDPKPYVIYGLLIIDSCELVLPAGASLYVHGGVANLDGNILNDGLLAFESEGKLTTQGTPDSPVIIQGDRLESDFADVAGQWTGLWMFPGSKGHKINYTTIKNSLVGIRVDSSAQLSIKNSKILNTSGSGLLGIHSNMFVENCLIHSNGSNGVVMSYGGTYTFRYTTIANYRNDASGVYMDNFVCEIPVPCGGEIFVNRGSAKFTNCIITGSSADEIDLVDFYNGEQPDQFQYIFENCIVRVDELIDQAGLENFLADCSNCIESSIQDTLFLDLEESIYKLDTMSIAEGKALPIQNLAIDIDGNPRDLNTPDIGCYEFQ